MTYSTAVAVPSALQGLTAVFGMGTGGTPALESPSLKLLYGVALGSKFFDMGVKAMCQNKKAQPVWFWAGLRCKPYK